MRRGRYAVLFFPSPASPESDHNRRRDRTPARRGEKPLDPVEPGGCRKGDRRPPGVGRGCHRVTARHDLPHRGCAAAPRRMSVGSVSPHGGPHRQLLPSRESADPRCPFISSDGLSVGCLCVRPARVRRPNRRARQSGSISGGLIGPAHAPTIRDARGDPWASSRSDPSWHIHRPSAALNHLWGGVTRRAAASAGRRDR